MTALIVCLSCEKPADQAPSTVTGWLTKADQSGLMTPVYGLSFSPTVAGGDDTITVDETVQYQQMDGFGASLTESAAYVICSNLNTPDRDDLMKKLFDRSRGIGISLLRQPVGASDFALSVYSYDDMPPGQTDPDLTNFSIGRDSNGVIPLLRQALSINPDLRIIASPWSPPGWMRSGDTMVQGGTLNLTAYAAYADYFVKYLQAYASAGIPVYAVTVQNEPGYDPPSYPGMILSATEEANFIKNNLGPAFASNAMATKIICYDHNWDNTNHALSVLGDAAARSFVAGSAWHYYAGQPEAMTAVYQAYASNGMGIWFTEGGSGTWIGEGADQGSWKACFLEQVRLMIRITRNWSKSVIWWNLALDQNGGPCVYTNTNNYGLVRIHSVSRAVETPFGSGYYALGHLSRFVMPNAFRIDSSSWTNRMESAAFRNPDGQIVLLLLNPTSGARGARVVWNGGSFVYAVPAESAVTFCWRDD